MLKTFIFTLVLFFSCHLSAQTSYEFGSFTVSKIRFGNGGMHISLDPAPKGCEGGNQYRMHLKVSNVDLIAYQEMTAGLITANATGQKISVLWYKNKGICSRTNILELTMFEFANKK